MTGVLRAQAEDFRVEESLGYEACGEGEHAFLAIRKRDLNTVDVARELARFAGVRQVKVGFAGLKDRHAVTTQHFSVQLPGKPDPDWSELDSDQLQVLQAQRHNRKIRRGSLRGNRFELVLRDVQGDKENAEALLQSIASQGVPNYFGPQRFGREASNLYRAATFLAGEGKRPKPEQMRMLFSAARSYLFNRVLAERVAGGTWNKALPGDVMLLAGSNRQFALEAVDAQIEQRIVEHDIHPSGPMPGEAGRTLQVSGKAAETELSALSDELSKEWIEGLVRRRVNSERRALRLVPEELSWQWLDDISLQLRFALPAGAYATTLVRELMAADPR